MQHRWQRRIFNSGSDLTIPRFASLVQCFAALAFAALSIARRRAKVRPQHSVRAGCAGVLSSPIVGCALLGVAQLCFMAGIRGMSEFWVLLAAVMAWHVAWWHAAAARNLRIEKPLRVAVSVAAIAVTAAPIVLNVGELAKAPAGPSRWW